MYAWGHIVRPPLRFLPATPHGHLGIVMPHMSYTHVYNTCLPFKKHEHTGHTKAAAEKRRAGIVAAPPPSPSISQITVSHSHFPVTPQSQLPLPTYFPACQPPTMPSFPFRRPFPLPCLPDHTHTMVTGIHTGMLPRHTHTYTHTEHA